MARTRIIKPSFFLNDDLGSISPLARLLFIHMWTVCDREGRMEDRPRQIKATGLPYDDCDGEELLCELASKGFIVRYEACGKKVIWICNFVKHQNPHPKENPSVLPALGQTEESHDLSRQETASSASTSLSLSSSLSLETSISPLPVDKKEVLKPSVSFEYRVQNFLSDSGYTATRQAADGWDIYRLMEIYNKGVNSGGMEKPKIADKAFPAWCRVYTKGKHPA
jgi:hypothetical protein